MARRPTPAFSRDDGRLLGGTGFAFETPERAATGYVLARMLGVGASRPRRWAPWWRSPGQAGSAACMLCVMSTIGPPLMSSRNAGSRAKVRCGNTRNSPISPRVDLPTFSVTHWPSKTRGCVPCSLNESDRK